MQNIEFDPKIQNVDATSIKSTHLQIQCGTQGAQLSMQNNVASMVCMPGLRSLEHDVVETIL